MHPHAIELARITPATSIDRVHFFDQIDSTNTAALDHADRSPADLCELFLADRQTSGRGRGANRWWSAEGSLTWSVLTPPLACQTAVLPQVSLSMGLAILSAIESFVAADVTLKWPNDVYLEGRKVSGILIEMAAQTRRLVVGVGLNVNNSIRQAPAELRASATSLIDAPAAQGTLFDRTAVLIECLNQMDRYLQRFVARDPRLPDEWRANSLLTGRQVRVATPQGHTTGQCQGIADDGALVVETASGIQHCHGGVVVDF